MIAFEKSRIHKQSNNEVWEVVKTIYGVILIKSRIFGDQTAQTRLYRVSFDDIGEIYSEGDKGIVISDSYTDLPIKKIHSINREKITEEDIRKINIS